MIDGEENKVRLEKDTRCYDKWPRPFIPPALFFQE